MSTKNSHRPKLLDKILQQNYETGSNKLNILVGGIVCASVIAYPHDYAEAVEFALSFVDKLEKGGVLAECCPLLVREEVRSMIGLAFSEIRTPGISVSRTRLTVVS